MFRWVTVLLALWVFAVTAAASEGSPEVGLQKSCQFFSKLKPFAYCIYHVDGSTNPDIVYYLHGAGGSEKRWLQHWRPVRDAWRTNHVEAPTVISISYGPVWLLAEKAVAKTSGLLDYTVKHGMPLLEKIAEDVTGLKGGRRLIIGESMGGFNTVQMVMKHPELFYRAAILCPALHLHSPFATRAELQKYAHENQTTLSTAIWETVMEKIFFPTQASWVSAEPFSLGARLLGPQTPPLYISNATHDNFGFYSGTKAFTQLAQERGVNVSYEEVEGKHCKFNAASISTFLTPPR